MYRFVNLTPHAVTVFRNDGSSFTIEPSGKVFRLRERDVVTANIDGVDVVRRQFYIAPEDLELFNDPSAVYIVSLPALMGLATITEPDLSQFWIVAPDTGGGAVRDEKGNITGTRHFVILP
jgi:hypothetical protein